MPTGLRQATREFYEGIALAGTSWISDLRRRRRRGTAVGAAVLMGAAAVVVHVSGAALGSRAAASTESGLMATDVGGLRTTGGPFGKRSGCAA